MSAAVPRTTANPVRGNMRMFTPGIPLSSLSSLGIDSTAASQESIESGPAVARDGSQWSGGVAAAGELQEERVDPRLGDGRRAGALAASNRATTGQAFDRRQRRTPCHRGFDRTGPGPVPRRWRSLLRPGHRPWRSARPDEAVPRRQRRDRRRSTFPTSDRSCRFAPRRVPPRPGRGGPGRGSVRPVRSSCPTSAGPARLGHRRRPPALRRTRPVIGQPRRRRCQPMRS